METFKVGICEPEDFSEKALELLNKYFQVEMFNQGILSDFVRDKDAIFVRLRYDITDELLAKAERLKYICSPTTGLNHISTTKKEIQIISLKGEYNFLSSIRATPEHVFGLSIALLRNYSHAFLNEGNTEWNRDLYKGFELFQSKIGIIGLGRIGKIIASYYNAFDARVGYYDVVEQKTDTLNVIQYRNMDSLIESSDMIILAANYTKENERMIGEHQIELMKGKYFINAARGELVDEKALIRKISDDYFKGVAIDVLQDEAKGYPNLPKLLELTEQHNLVITPHIGGATYTSMMRTEEFIADKLIATIEKKSGT